MPLHKRVDPVRIELTTPGEWVEVRSRLSQDGIDRITSAGIKARLSAERFKEAASTDFDVDATAMRRAQVLEGLIAWSFDDEVTPENVGLLDPDDFALIFERTSELYRRRSDDERKNSNASGTPRSADPAASHPNSAG